MPWRGPRYDGEFPSLGWDVAEWAETHFRVPDGPLAGEPLRLTDEQLRIVVRFYGLDDRGRFLFRRAAVRRAQGWGKSPLLAVVALAELAGPSRFAGWSDDGEPQGTRPVTPWVQIAASSEDQTDNTYAALYAMAQDSDLNGSLLDVGLTRIYLRGETGRLEPVTAAAGTRLGQRITFAVLDETHLWTRRNGGLKLAATIRRNAAKMNGRTFESTNAHEVGEDSVAERTAKAADKGTAGLLYDSVEPPDAETVDLGDRAAVLGALAVAYGDSVQHVDIERIADDIADPGTDPDDARRFFFNCAGSSMTRPVDMRLWAELAKPGLVVPARARVALGFDGSISDDKTALYGFWQGHVFEVAVWARPDPRDRDWRVPRADVHEAVVEAFDRFDVGMLVPDPAKWWSEIQAWQALWPGRVVELDTNQARRFAPACGRFMTACRERQLSHDGGALLTGALAACAKKKVRVADDEDDGRTQYVFVKADTRKIDEAVAAVLALEGGALMAAVESDPEFEPFMVVT